ncbi:MAG: hypothetical protein WC246_03720 [Candidatus Paceibacterota bacterium]|jgi:hypothetical protein
MDERGLFLLRTSCDREEATMSERGSPSDAISGFLAKLNQKERVPKKKMEVIGEFLEYYQEDLLVCDRRRLDQELEKLSHL